jgi:hypothetical protein
VGFMGFHFVYSRYCDPACLPSLSPPKGGTRDDRGNTIVSNLFGTARDANSASSRSLHERDDA